MQEIAMHEERRDAAAVFGARVRQLRLAVGHTQEELAFEAQLHPTYISGIERGRRNPTVLVMLRLMRALRCSAGSLLEGIAATDDGRRRRLWCATGKE